MNVKLLSHIVLREGIAHIEDLPLREFIRTVESMKDKIITEKLDGANLWFGLDERGLYTSREGKSSRKSRFYKLSDYPVIAAYNGFRGAHLAVEKSESIIRKYLKEGDSVEVEVLYGRQPNTVTYGVEGKNFIVVLRGVNSTPEERIQNLANALSGKQVNVESTVVSSPDGDTLNKTDEKMVWEFTKVTPIVGDKIKTDDAMKLLAALKKYADEPNKNFTELTNGQMSEINLTSVSKDKRALAKSERDRVNEFIMSEFKAPIKEQLLDKFVRKIKPMLQDPKLHPSEDVGVEGVVLRDPVTGSQTKIVDRDVFTAINSFNAAVRANISGLVRTADQDAPIESRGGAFGQAKIRIAHVLGQQDLAVGSAAKRLITKFKKTDAASTALALAQSLNIQSLPSIRTKVSAILRNTLEEVNGILQQFKQEAGEFKLQLKTGKEIGISPEVMRRTLTAFAETKKEIAEINNKVLASRSPADLVLALYGRTISSLFSEGDSEVNESYSLIKSVSEDEGATAAATTSAGDIAPVEKRVFHNSKVVVKRKRNFTSPKKFPIPKVAEAAKKPSSRVDFSFEKKSDAEKKEAELKKQGYEWVQIVPNAKTNRYEVRALKKAPIVPESLTLIKSFNEDWAHASDMKFATDVDDSAQGASDVEFKQLRNNVNLGGEITQMDVNRYLDKAHELNDQVDTITFGLETDDGKVVKVYVNAAQANEFEKAMAELLGSEDDVETAINQLATRFDIVDVEWPADIAASQAETPINGEDSDVSPEDGNPEIDLSVFGDEGPSDESSGDDEITDASSDETSDEADDSDDSESEDDDEERNDFGEIVKKKKKKKKAAVKDETPANDEDESSEETTTEESYALIGSVLEAEEGKWMIGDLKTMGVQISTRGLIIKLSDDVAHTLLSALKSHESASITANNSKKFNFDAASDGGFVVHEDGKETVAVEMPAEEVAKVVKALSAK